MDLVNIKTLANHFNLKSLMDLFRIDWIIEKIKNFKFFIAGEPREIIKDSDNEIYYMSEHPNGLGILKVWINETNIKFIEILKSEFYKLIGKTHKETPKNKEQPKESKINSETFLTGLFIAFTGSLVAWKGYSHFKK